MIQLGPRNVNQVLIVLLKVFIAKICALSVNRASTALVVSQRPMATANKVSTVLLVPYNQTVTPMNT